MINKAQLVSGAATPAAPAAVTNGDNYLLAWRDASGGISFTHCPAKQGQDSYAWDKQVQVPNVATSGAPALANFKGVVYMAWKGETSDFVGVRCLAQRISFLGASGGPKHRHEHNAGDSSHEHVTVLGL